MQEEEEKGSLIARINDVIWGRGGEMVVNNRINDHLAGRRGKRVVNNPD
ncbi:hypothetical protein [Cytobacillus oceanisediminis]